MNRKNGRLKSEFVFLLVCSLGLVYIFVHRLMYGIEVSDEAFYEVVGMRLMRGNLPYGDMWEVNAADSYVMLPLFFIRSFFFSGNEGVHLFCRVGMLALNFLGLVAIYIYCSKDIKREYSYLLGLFLVFFAPFQIYNFSYNNIASLFLTIALCMMLTQIKAQKVGYAFFAGFAMAVGVMCYPTMVICCVIVAVLIFVINGHKNGVKPLVMYIIGGIAVAIPVMTHLIITVGFRELITNLQIILSSGGPSLSINEIFLSFIYAVAYFRVPFFHNGILFCLYWVFLIVCVLSERTKIIGKYMVVFYPLICCLYANSHNAQSVMDYAFYLVLIGPMAVLISANKMKMLRRFILEYGLSMMFYFVIAFSSSGGAGNARGGLVFAAIVSLRLIVLALQEMPEIRFEKIAIYFMIISSLISEIFVFYGGIYRDKPFRELSEKIETGIYKGIYTTPERKQHIIDLEEVMHQVEEKDKTVMILYHSCYAYLMVDMVPKTPSTWGCINTQMYGYDNNELFMKYLENEDNIPEIILIVDIPEEYDYAGQKTSNYEQYYPKLNDYIREHYIYEGTYEKGKSGTVIKYEVNWNTFM